jgi:hypothetical protein
VRRWSRRSLSRRPFRVYPSAPVNRQGVLEAAINRCTPPDPPTASLLSARIGGPKSSSACQKAHLVIPQGHLRPPNHNPDRAKTHLAGGAATDARSVRRNGRCLQRARSSLCDRIYASSNGLPEVRRPSASSNDKQRHCSPKGKPAQATLPSTCEVNRPEKGLDSSGSLLRVRCVCLRCQKL